MIKKISIIILILFSALLSFSQNNVTSRIFILKNSTTRFIFDSMHKFNNGIELKDWTELKIYYNDTIAGGLENPATTGWELNVRANTPNFQADYGGVPLELDKIIIKTFYDGTTYGPFTLSSSDVEIATGTSGLNVNKNILISYECGMDVGNSLLNYFSEFYSTDLIFTIKSKD